MGNNLLLVAYYVPILCGTDQHWFAVFVFVFFLVNCDSVSELCLKLQV